MMSQIGVGMDDDLRQLSNQDHQELLHALSNLHSQVVKSATYNLKSLSGGTVAEVYSVEGKALLLSQKESCYRLVFKRQKQWHRPGDEHSWRREYDLYTSQMNLLLTDTFRMPKCYLAVLHEGENHLWLEHIEGFSGSDLTVEMLEVIAYELGVFHAKTFLHSKSLSLPTNITSISFLENELTQWYRQSYSYAFLISKECRLPNHVKEMLKSNPWNDEHGIVYHYLRSELCDIPVHLKDMILSIDQDKDVIFNQLYSLPRVLNHRDFWIENLFFQDGHVCIIDWDCVGWGMLGEDLASLIGDDTPTNLLVHYFNHLMDAYQRGLRNHHIHTYISKNDIINIILIKYGYRLIQNYMFEEDFEMKSAIVQRLQTFYLIQAN